jgi:hypothetical protein
MFHKVFFGMAALVLITGLRAAEAGFSGRLTPEEFARAGLGKPTPAGRAQLDALVARHASAGNNAASAARGRRRG